MSDPLKDHQSRDSRNALTRHVVTNSRPRLVKKLPAELVYRSGTCAFHRFFYDLGSSRIMFTSLGG